MLIVKRRKGDCIHIGQSVVTVLSTHQSLVKLGIEAPADVKVQTIKAADAAQTADRRKQ